MDDFLIRESRPEAATKESYTYGDYLLWSDEERWELIDGFPFRMSAAPSRLHQAISRELLTQFNFYLKGKPCEVYAAPFDVRLPKGNEVEEEIDSVVQPDLVVVCESSKLDERGCKGAPDLVVEIISTHTALKDMKIKHSLYERVGVKEYWLVDPANKIVQVYELADNSQYGKPRIYAAQERVKVGIFPDLIIELATIFVE